MAELESFDIDHLATARQVLRGGLKKSIDIALALNKTCPRLEEINRTLPSLEVAIKTVAQKCTLFAIKDHIELAIGPAAAVLTVFNAVKELENELSSDPCSHLFNYLFIVKRLEEALKLLTDNCRLVIPWLEDVAQCLEHTAVADNWYLENVNGSLRTLRELQAIKEESHMNGGPLNAALNKLEYEFRRILTEHSFPLPVPCSQSFLEEQTCLTPLPLPLPVVQKLQAIIERLNTNNRLENCIDIYAEVRSSNSRATLQALDLDYLEISLSEFDSVQSIEGYIDQWSKHLEFTVKHILELECRLCNHVFHNVGLDVRTDCFGKIAWQSGLDAFIRFGNTVTNGKKEAIKLFKLLEIFEALNKLRMDFNQLFGGRGCIEIQTQTRDLIKKVVNGASQIFWELSIQVESQRHSSPPPDGSVPRLISFVSDYCNQLLEDDCTSILNQVLGIHMNWRNEKYFEGLVSSQVLNIIKALELNLGRWAKRYSDDALSYLFLMNNHWFFCKNLKGTKLECLLGDSWLKAHEEYVEYYAAMYLRDSWGKLPALLNVDGQNLFSGGRAIARDLVKKRLKSFNEGFDDMYKKQCNWVVSDKGLRLRTCQLIVQVIIPVYRSYMNNYLSLIEQRASPSKCVKYSAESLENMLSTLLQPKLGKYGSIKCTYLTRKIKDVVTSHFSSTPAAA